MSHTPTYLIFGATGSVGSALTKRLRSQDAKVIAAVRNEDKARSLSELEEAQILTCDATSWDSVQQLQQTLAASDISLDGIAVCVGSILLKPAHLTRPEEFEATLHANLTPCLAVARSFTKGMMKNGGSLVFVSSAAARHGFPNHEAIAAAKAGIIGLTLSAAATYANYGIRFNCVAPGLVESQMAAPILNNELSLRTSKAMHALGRIGSPVEVASAIAWLLDSEQSWVTGQTIGIDGGLGSLHSKKR